MKRKVLEKIIAIAVICTSISTVTEVSVFATGPSSYYNWPGAVNYQANGYWKQYNGKWYYYNFFGVMQKGWIYDKGQWYYADSSGVMQTGVIQVEGKIYLLSESGAMQTGNAVINGVYYSFDESGAAKGSNVPVPTKAYDFSGAATVSYVPSQIIEDEDSSPIEPNTEARDPNNLIKYTVKFKDDDGDELKTSNIEKNDKITLYKPTKKGYKFIEWTTKKDGGGKSYDFGDQITITDNLTLYAQWEDSDESGNTGSEDKVAVEDITVTSSTGSSAITTKGGTLQMKVKVLPVDATNNKVTWSVENTTGKATISESGLLTASANGTIAVVATAKDGSKVVGRTNITISGQSDSGTTNPGGGTTNPGGGTTTPQTGGIITAFDPNVKLDDVTIGTAGDIVDLSLLKASGKLPTKAKVTCSLSSGKVQEIEVGIKDWTGTFDGKNKGEYTLNATLGNLPTGYTKSDNSLSLPADVKLKVIVSVQQTDARKEITSAASISDITLDSDKHIMNADLLNASGVLPKTVTLNYDGGSVNVNVRTWNCVAFSEAAGAHNELVAELEIPAGYVISSGFKVTMNLNVTTQQTSMIQEIVEVIKNADRLDGKTLPLNYASGDALDLTNLLVKVKYNDGVLGEISYADFGKNNITTPGYFNGMPLTTVNSTTTGIPVMFNGKKVYTEPLAVVQALSPSITLNNGTYNITSPSNVVVSYSLGTGAKESTGIESVTLGGTNLVLNNEYTLDNASGKLTIKDTALSDFYTQQQALGKATPYTHVLKIIFTPKSGTTKTTISANISFISKPDMPSGITLATTVADVPAKDNTIKLLGLKTNVTYEYCVGDTESWNNAKYFVTTEMTKELTDTSFVAGKNLYIRIKSISDGKGAINPPSTALTVGPLAADNIGKTKSSEKSIKSFSLSDEANTYAGTITEGISSATIKVIVPTVGQDAMPPAPTEMDISNLAANFTLSDDKATVKVGGSTGTLQESGVTTNNFDNKVEYTVIAENGTTKTYAVNVTKAKLQESTIRPDTLQKTVITSVEVTDPVTGVKTTEQQSHIETFKFFDGYNNAGLAINAENGIVNIAVPGSFTTGTTSQSSALNSILEWTPYMKDKDPQSAYVGIKFVNPYTQATKVKVAESFSDLISDKNITTIQLSGDGINVLGGQYLEQIPVAKYGTQVSGVWSKFTSSKTKYYEWVDSSGNILGYTSLTIVVK